MAPERTHFVYEAYDADGICLYVGCTGNPAARYRSHMTGNSDARGWFGEFVIAWRVAGPYPKQTALAIEKARINERQPIWNGQSVGNNWGKRQLIADYLAFHGVRFQENPNRLSRPDLVPADRRHLRSVRSA